MVTDANPTQNQLKVKRISIIIACVVCMLLQDITLARAQSSEFGALFGTTFYLGDINQSKLFKNSHLAGGFAYRYNISPRWAVRGNFLFGKVSASDAAFNNTRNLSFMSPITEFSAVAELNFLKLYNVPQKNHFTPYIFAGITLFSFNPQAQLDSAGTWYELQSLGTEGQGIADTNGLATKRYSLTNVAIPFGIGIKVNIGRHFTIGAEWGIRYTFTDYLDDVRGVYFDNEIIREQRGSIPADLADRTPELTNPSTHEPYPFNVAGTQRGNVRTTDIYSFAGIFFTVKFGNESKTCDLLKPRHPRH